MTNKLLTTVMKSLGAKIAWIGGATAGITAVLSAIGFLVIRAHHDLLGITGLVPTPPDTWTIEGARFVYNSIFYIVAGIALGQWRFLLPALAIIILIAFAANAQWLTKIHALTKFRVVRVIILLLTLAGLILVIWLFLHDPGISHVLVRPVSQQIEEAVNARNTQEGIDALRLDYARFAIIVLLAFLWLKLLPALFPSQAESAKQKNSPVASLSGVSAIFWFLFLIPLILLPMKYGEMMVSNEYFKVCLLTSIETGTSSKQCSGSEGWMLYKDSNDIVLYQASSPQKPVQVYKHKEFKHIQVLTFDNLFTAVPTSQSTSTSTGTGASLGQTVQNIGTLLLNFPQTIAEGILARNTRKLDQSMLLRTLVIADAEGNVLNALRPFGADEKGYLQSPVWLPDDRILFVEVRGSTPTLKVISETLPAAQFGPAPIEGWEPHLAPDNHTVIFRQGATIIKTDREGNDLVPLVQDKQVEELFGVLPGDEEEEFWLVFSEAGKGDVPDILWIARIQGDRVSYEALSDRHWRLLKEISMHDSRMLYAQVDEMYKKTVWNLYLRDSSEQEGRRITNLKAQAASDLYHSRYPAWNLDGSRMVYASREIDEE